MRSATRPGASASGPDARRPIALAVVALAAAAAVAVLAAAASGDAPALQKGRVEWVSDGDTITVRIGETKEKVRMVGIDTPELDDANPWWRALAERARDHARSRLLGRTVVLEPDAIGADRDKYGRLLRYVILDGEDVNEEMIREGYARAYTRFAFGRATRYREAEKAARAAKIGRWTPRETRR